MKSWTKSEGAKKGWGKTILNARAALEEVAAFFWDFDSQASIDISGDVERLTLEEEKGEFEKVVRRRQNIMVGTTTIRERHEFVYRMSLHVIGDNQIIIIAETVADRVEESKDYERGSESFAIKLLRQGDLETKVEFVTEIGFSEEAGRSNLSKAALRNLQSMIERQLEELTTAKMFFEYRVEAADMTEKDGELLGNNMIWACEGNVARRAAFDSFTSRREKEDEDFSLERASSMRMMTKRTTTAMSVALTSFRGIAISNDVLNDRVEEIIERSFALRTVRSKYPWIVTVVQRARRGAVVANRPVSKNAKSMSEYDAKIVGNNLMPALKRHKTVAGAIQQWRGQNKAMDELLAEFPWMKGLFASLGQGIVNAAPWGLKWRVFVGAALSTVDLGTDLYITYTFWSDGKENFFKCSIAMLGASMFFMLFIVWVQNRKLGYRRTLLEKLPVLLGLKPAVDAFRVASGARIEAGQLFDPLLEMTYMRGIEMFAEAIPGVILQLFALLSYSDRKASSNYWAIASLVVSALTTGFISSSISFDWDTDPKKRIANPEFYGFIPNSARGGTVVFMSMLLLSAAMLLVRALVLVMLGLVSQSAALLYVCFDMGLYLLFKIVRGDFFYWLPLNGFLEIIASLLVRIISKVIVDYTSNAHFRHTYEVGGAYWSFGFVLTLMCLPLSVFYYEREVGIPEVAQIGWNACFFFIPFTLLVMLTFIVFIKKEFRKTFYDLKRGKDVTLAYFKSSEDERKVLVFKNNHRHWKSIEGKVEKWVRENWGKWLDEEPQWLDDNMKARIPPHMIPNLKDREKIEDLQNKRRRTSILGNVVSGRRRSSLIRAEKVAPNSAIGADREIDENDVIREKG